MAEAFLPASAAAAAAEAPPPAAPLAVPFAIGDAGELVWSDACINGHGSCSYFRQMTHLPYDGCHGCCRSSQAWFAERRKPEPITRRPSTCCWHGSSSPCHRRPAAVPGAHCAQRPRHPPGTFARVLQVHCAAAGWAVYHACCLPANTARSLRQHAASPSSMACPASICLTVSPCECRGRCQAYFFQAHNDAGLLLCVLRTLFRRCRRSVCHISISTNGSSPQSTRLGHTILPARSFQRCSNARAMPVLRCFQQPPCFLPLLIGHS